MICLQCKSEDVDDVEYPVYVVMQGVYTLNSLASHNLTIPVKLSIVIYESKESVTVFLTTSIEVKKVVYYNCLICNICYLMGRQVGVLFRIRASQSESCRFESWSLPILL